VLPVCGVTVAVKVMLWPVLIAVLGAVSTVLVWTGAAATVTTTGAETEAELLVLPP
jgi:hypothetical protein